MQEDDQSEPRGRSNKPRVGVVTPRWRAEVAGSRRRLAAGPSLFLRGRSSKALKLFFLHSGVMDGEAGAIMGVLAAQRGGLPD